MKIPKLSHGSFFRRCSKPAAGIVEHVHCEGAGCSVDVVRGTGSEGVASVVATLDAIAITRGGARVRGFDKVPELIA